MKKATILITVIFSITVYSCRYNDKDNRPPQIVWHEFTQEFHDYCNFPVGSYWVYRDSISGKVDSLYMLSKRLALKKDGDINCHMIIYDDCHIGESMRDSSFSSLRQDTVEGYGYVDVMNSSISFTSPLINRAILSSPFKNYAIPPLQRSLDSLTLNDNIFIDVKIFGSGTHFDTGNQYFIAKGIGLVKTKYFPGINLQPDTIPVWELIRYHINN